VQNLQVLSNTQISFTLPTPTGFNFRPLFQAGAASPLGQAPSHLEYAPFPVIIAVGAVTGCVGSGVWQATNCQAGDVIQILGPAAAFPSPLSVTIGSSSLCSTPTTNANSSTVICTLPEVSSSDLGQWLPVTVNLASQASAPFTKGVQYAESAKPKWWLW